MYKNTDHTFAVCAYKESEFLPACIESLFSQSVKSKIIICTSTPNEHIRSIAEKYEVSLKINNRNPSIYGDWNFAYSQVKTKLITLAHQDDIYAPEYLKTALSLLNKSKKTIIFFSHYAEIRDAEIVYKNKLLNIKKLMLKPLKFFKNSVFIRRRVLSLGNPICCPSVMYTELNNLEFSDEYSTSLDWELWERLSRRKGSFVYCEKPLIYHRIHKNSETSSTIEKGVRSHEDYRMFRLFWGKSIAALLAKWYSKSEESNNV